MEKQVKYDTLLEFIQDLTNVVDKVNNNSANLGDYIKLKEYFLMVGIKENTIDGIYSDCGFVDVADFFKQRQLSRNHQSGNVSCSASKIDGLKEAVVEVLECEIAKDMSKC